MDASGRFPGEVVLLSSVTMTIFGVSALVDTLFISIAKTSPSTIVSVIVIDPTEVPTTHCVNAVELEISRTSFHTLPPTTAKTLLSHTPSPRR